MKELMNQLLEALRARVVENLKIVHTNEAQIRLILKEPLSSARKLKLDERYELSKRILKENEASLQIQNLIVNFISKYRNVSDFNQEVEELNTVQKMLGDAQEGSSNFNVNQTDNRDSGESQKHDNANEEHEEVVETTADSQNKLLNLTIIGELQYSSKHPMFGNETFFNKLLSYYIQREEYEVCAELVKINTR